MCFSTESLDLRAVQCQDCFKQGEIAQLRLEMKRESAEPPSEEELKAGWRKNSKFWCRKVRRSQVWNQHLMLCKSSSFAVSFGKI